MREIAEYFGKNSDNVSLNKGMNAFMVFRVETEKSGIQDMTLDEINGEIQKTRYGKDE